jgi:hypothetical protein
MERVPQVHEEGRMSVNKGSQKRPDREGMRRPSSDGGARPAMG